MTSITWLPVTQPLILLHFIEPKCISSPSKGIFPKNAYTVQVRNTALPPTTSFESSSTLSLHNLHSPASGPASGEQYPSHPPQHYKQPKNFSTSQVNRTLRVSPYRDQNKKFIAVFLRHCTPWYRQNRGYAFYWIALYLLYNTRSQALECLWFTGRTWCESHFTRSNE